MQFWIGVENFAKIESAKICIDSYTVLVGQNNSGKTLLMQLVQGVSGKIASLFDDGIINILLSKEMDGVRKYVISNDNISDITTYLNEKLQIKKEDIVKEIFGKEIFIDKLYIDISMKENFVYEIEIFEDKENSQTIIGDNISSFKNVKKLNKVQLNQISNKQTECLMCLMFSTFLCTSDIKSLQLPLKYIFEYNSLFFPASRTGLLLLYREFFANKTDNIILYNLENNKPVENEDRYGGLTKPMYEFLRFLQTYSEDDEEKIKYVNELLFFEENLIEGHINVGKQGTLSYEPKKMGIRVPMYLASAMVNEVAPLILAITGRNRYERLIIDEVEASLHPEKQQELVRFLNRLNNKGMKLIVSTHSDTFVSKLNNLYILSEYINTNQENKMMEILGLEKDDLIHTNNLFVYEFINQPNGKSIAREIKADKKLGYQFDLFTRSAVQIYEEAVKLGEIQEDARD